MAQFRITWPAKNKPQRLDIAVHEQLPDLSRRKIRKIIDVGGVYLNGKRLRIASRLVQPGDRLVIEYDPNVLDQVNKPTTDLHLTEVLECHPCYVVINKPAGLPSQPTRQQAISHVGKKVEEFLKHSGERKFRTILVHRLDKETSGVMIVARDPKTATYLTDQFKTKSVVKEYWALVAGRPVNDKFVETARLARLDRKGFVRIDKLGRTAETKFELLWTNSEISLIRCLPTTGRSHQIRVHLAHNGLPIIGDKRYCQKAVALPAQLNVLAQQRHLLHAAAMVLQPLPDGPAKTFSAPLPEEIGDWLASQGFSPTPVLF